MAKENKPVEKGTIPVSEGYQPTEKRGYQPTNSATNVVPPKGGIGEVTSTTNNSTNDNKDKK